MSEGFLRVRNSASMLAPASRGAARLLMERVTAAPRRVYAGAGLAALLAAIGGNALLLQAGRHPATVLVEAARDPAATEAPAPPHVSAARVASLAAPTADPPDTAPPAAPPAAVRPRAAQTPAPDATSSLGPAQPPSRGEGVAAAAHADDPIGALLRSKPVDEESRRVRAAQVALEKLGYPVKPDGVEDGATRRALRRFQRAHGLTPTTEITAELVKQLIAAARTGG